MTWFQQSANETEAARTEGVRMVVAVDFEFPSGTVRFWSGLGDLVIGLDTYLGAGQLGKISVVPERTGLIAEQKTYQLSGVDPTIIPESEIDDSFGLSVVERFGFLNPTTGALVATPEIAWEGRIDGITRVDGFDPLISVNAEHRLVMLDQADGWRYTHEHQQRFYSGDDGFSLVKKCQLRTILWNGKRVVNGYTPRGRTHTPIYEGDD